ncbi:MAG: 23S rRNA (uracil(1939)-C(5))-methyltransferase RlmD [Patescibacteria group bacterium]
MPKVKIEKLVGGGQGLGRIDGKAVFVWGALAGEEVEVNISKDKKNFSEGTAQEISVASKERVTAKEDHYLSCSPWQILSWEEEMKWKKEIIKENFLRLAKMELPEFEVFGDKKSSYHYRNKIEYNLISDGKRVELAIFGRETNELISIKECCLAKKCLNEQAKKIVAWINKRSDSERFKKIILQCNEQDETLAVIFVDDKIAVEDGLMISEKLNGVFVYQLLNDGVAQLLFHEGKEFLTEKIMNVELRHAVNSFFQINIPIFCSALTDISRFLAKENEVIDYYAGVGAISLALAKHFARAILVEGDQTAVALAGKNIAANKIYNCETVSGSVEKQTKLITARHVLILDPPRTGLSRDLINQILFIKPRRLIYLSCDSATQARDIGLLSGKYRLIFTKAYNFFPRTPHVECLCVLESK